MKNLNQKLSHPKQKPHMVPNYICSYIEKNTGKQKQYEEIKQIR